MDKIVLIEKTSKQLKYWEFIITTMLFLTFLSGFGLLYVAIPLAIITWSLTIVCLLAFIAVRIVVWWLHG